MFGEFWGTSYFGEFWGDDGGVTPPPVDDRPPGRVTPTRGGF